MRNDIIYRISEVIRYVAPPNRRLKYLEEETGIPDRNWKQVWSGKQRPTAHMIESLGRRWPQYAFWTITGITDEENGHTAPPNAWTCNQKLSFTNKENAAVRYFNLKIFEQDSVYGTNGAASSNYVVKKHPTEEEILAVKEAHDGDTPEVQELLDNFFGKENAVWKKKHDDLDEAIAQIAFDRRLKTLKSEFVNINPTNQNDAILKELEAIMRERREDK